MNPNTLKHLNSAKTSIFVISVFFIGLFVGATANFRTPKKSELKINCSNNELPDFSKIINGKSYSEVEKLAFLGANDSRIDLLLPFQLEKMTTKDKKWKGYVRNFLAGENLAIIKLAEISKSRKEFLSMVRPFMARWRSNYLELLYYLIDNKYKFTTYRNYLDDKSTPKVVLRFDIHDRDLPTALILAALNEEIGIPASYFIHWKKQAGLNMDNENMLLIKKFLTPISEVGIHISPVDGWFEEYCKQNMVWLEKKPSKSELLNFMYEQSGSKEKAINHFSKLGLEYYKDIARNFQASFGTFTSVSAHGASGGLTRTIIDNISISPFKVLTSKIFFKTQIGSGALDVVEAYDFDAKNGYGYVTDNFRDFQKLTKRLEKLVVEQNSLSILIHPYVLSLAEKYIGSDDFFYKKTTASSHE